MNIIYSMKYTSSFAYAGDTSSTPLDCGNDNKTGGMTPVQIKFDSLSDETNIRSSARQRQHIVQTVIPNAHYHCSYSFTIE